MTPEEIAESVGMFLSSFNEIEAQTYLLLRKLPADELTDYGQKIDRFEPRTRFVQALLRSSGWDDREEVSDLLDRALKLSKYRNKLSHNPIRVTYYGYGDSSQLEEISRTEAKLIDAKKGSAINQAFNGLLSLIHISEPTRPY